MSMEHLLLLSLVVAVAAFVQGAVGVGFALIAAPVMSLLEPALLPVALLLLMIPLNLYVVLRERAEVDRSGAGWITLGRAAGTLGGLWVLAALSPSQLGLFVGIATLAAVAMTLAVPAFSPARPAFLAAGLVTGVTETATGIGGPPLALVYQHQPPPVMRSTVALCFLVGEVISLVLLIATGHAPAASWTGTAWLLPALVVGAVASRFVHRRVNGKALRVFVLGFAVVSSVVLLLR